MVRLLKTSGAKLLGVLSNCQTPVKSLSVLTDRAAAMLGTRSYLHQYEKYGVGTDEIATAILAVEQIRSNYERL